MNYFFGKIEDLAGKQFGRWTVMSRVKNLRDGSTRWLCRCQCGVVREVNATSLRSGKSRSCGCFMMDQKRTHGKTGTAEYTMLVDARRRAKAAGVPFNLDISDIVFPSHCPIFGTPLRVHYGERGGKEDSPSLDRIVPTLGYVRGNVWVVSMRANRMKDVATLAELKQLVFAVEKKMAEMNPIEYLN